MSKTIEVTSAIAPANEATPVEVKHEAIDYATANTALRREMAKVVFGKIIDNLSDDDLDKYVSVADDINTKYSAHLKHEVAAHEPEAAAEQETAPAEMIGAPTGFPETKDIEVVLETTNPLTVSWRTKFMYAVNWPITTIYGKMFDNAQKYSQKLQGWSDEEKQAHIEKVGRRSTALAALGALGLAAYTAITKTNFDITAPGSSSNLREQATSHGNVALMDSEHRNASSQSTVRSSVESESKYDVPQAGAHHELSDFAYNPAQDPTLSPLKHGNDFGPAPNVDPQDAKANMNAAAESWRHSPGSFATVMSKLGLVKNDAASINQLAEDMKAHPNVFQANYNLVMDKLADAKIHIEPVTGPYGSYYAVNIGGGKSVIAYDPYVQGDGYMLVVEPKDSPAFSLHGKCLFQPSDYVQQAPAKPAVHLPQTTSVAPEQPVTPVRPVQPVQPSTPTNPETPTIPGTPIIPGTPTGPETPPTNQPKSSNPFDYQAPGRDNTTDSGTGVKPRVDSGALTLPPVVEQHRESQQPASSTGAKAPADSSTNHPNSETGGKRAGGNSNPNSGVGKAGKPQSTGGATNSGDPGGPAV